MDCSTTYATEPRFRAHRRQRIMHSLASHPLFAPCDEYIQYQLAAHARIERFKRGDMIYRRGAPADSVFCLLEGSVQLVALDADGRERALELFGANDLFGEINLLLSHSHRHWAQANLMTRTVRIPRSTFLDALERDPALSRRVMLEVSRRAERLMERICCNATPKGVLRVVHYLSNLVDDSDNAQTVALPATKRTIASLLNLTHESFSRLLRQLSDDGLIEVQGRCVHIPDVRRLQAQEALR
ncbi:Crp/Fnr family transcriptional regulator [Nitrogeniibacter aestuarii]|uniref:Crp/Fnr family transcriptional regulator n=1 Tax=Nitrogeniibacter aestuarii TaxID=2815343 RepID=UPI001D10F27F|nr:Crp/Fnr family transcriptional regulator [Nitrogeniibacter aestuarii]